MIAFRLYYLLKNTKCAALLCSLLLWGGSSVAFGQSGHRTITELNKGWRTVANDSNKNAYNGFENRTFNDRNWSTVSVPHNWDTYEGVRRMKHGNRHGYAWYRKTFTISAAPVKKQRYFLFFEGVGSYATVYLNGRLVGYHAGGRTTFTIDITDAVVFNQLNILSVRADHPAFIKDLPWVCGGCSNEIGFSEGSQPMGIFRPVSLIVTNEIRVEPFGVHIWNDTTVSEKSAAIFIATACKNYGSGLKDISIRNILLDKEGHIVAEATLASPVHLNSIATTDIYQQLSLKGMVHLWSLEDPYLYQLKTQISINGKVVDEVQNTYGIRWISWPMGSSNSGSKQFLLNGKPVFINGTAAYEHLLGASHAFSDQEIMAMAKQVSAAGFNAFRDAHQPHNLKFQQYWDEKGLLWWPQFAAHIWYDTPEFRNNFKTLLRDWVKERRNNPSNILWGLENESVLPADFARECCDMIRGLDPTASAQRKITTCNGGEGTDWDVPQNWTGTYGGSATTYARDLKKQVLVGEYGSWRSLDLHTEINTNTTSEDKMVQILETKLRLAESVKDSVCGHFNWILYSHENPGRVQSGEGYRELDRICPVNYKGLFTLWGEPTDAFYMYRSNYTSKSKEPMVYIVSHTWPDRWIATGIKDSIKVFSNCDEVELFNDVQSISLGRKKSKGIGTHFEWNGVAINYNILYAVGYVNGKPVSKDCIVLNHLPVAPHYALLTDNKSDIIQPDTRLNYIYRVNCGGAAYKDKFGYEWMADGHQTKKDSWGSLSWADDYKGVPAFFASQRNNTNPLKNTSAWPLFQSCRYGRDKLSYEFPVANGDYTVELYFSEPWYGIGGGMDCSGWRLFDVAVNDKIVHQLDIWKEADIQKAVKKIVEVHVTNGQIQISFPTVTAGQAIIAAIAIASSNHQLKQVSVSPCLIEQLKVVENTKLTKWSVQSWLNTGEQQYTDDAITFSKLPSVLYGADWLKGPHQLSASRDIASFTVSQDAQVFIAVDTKRKTAYDWMKGFVETKTVVENDRAADSKLMVYKKQFTRGEKVLLGSCGNDPLYLVAVTPVSTMGLANDLKTTVTYKSVTAKLSGPGVFKDSVNGKSCLSFSRESGDSIIWNISVGVADVYTLRLRYVKETAEILRMTGKIIAADGTVMKEELLEFPPYKKGKWGIAETTTGTSINAGNYRVILSSKNAKSLIIGSLEVQ